MRTCPRCGYKDPAMQKPDTRKHRDRAAYMRAYRKRVKRKRGAVTR